MTILDFEIYLLILSRIASFIFASPFFSIRGIPAIFKIGFSLILAFIVFMALPQAHIDIAGTLVFYLLIMKEVVIGLFMGIIATLIFKAIQIAGQLTDIQIGFAMSAIFDPATQSSTSLFGRLYNWIGLVIFFTIDGHHYLLKAVTDSFTFTPVGLVDIGQVGMMEVVYIFSRSFLVAFQIGIPLIIVAFMTDVVMGFIARTVPQLNVFILGMPFKVLVTLFAFLLLLPVVSNLMVSVIGEIPKTINELMRMLG